MPRLGTREIQTQGWFVYFRSANHGAEWSTTTHNWRCDWPAAIRVKVTTVGAPVYSLAPPHYAGQFDVEEIPWSLERLPSFLEWYRIMKQRPAEIAIFPKNWWAKGGLGMMWAAKLAYPRVVVREHVAVPELHRPEGGRFLGIVPRPALWYQRHRVYSKLMSAVPDVFICNSTTTRRRLVDGCGYPPDRTVTVHNGVDCEIFRSDAEVRRRYRLAQRISSRALVYGAVGRIDNGHKRHDLSLRQFARLCAEFPDHRLHFLLVGAGRDRQAMLDLAVELGVADRLTIAPFTADPWEAYNAIDVFLMPSAFEAFGLALAEAMACERCVIGMTVEGIGEILEEPGVGFGVPRDDVEAFYGAMCKAYLLGNRERARMGARARESIVRRFDADQQYERIIEQVLGTCAKHEHRVPTLTRSRTVAEIR